MDTSSIIYLSAGAIIIVAVVIILSFVVKSVEEVRNDEVVVLTAGMKSLQTYDTVNTGTVLNIINDTENEWVAVGTDGSRVVGDELQITVLSTWSSLEIKNWGIVKISETPALTVPTDLVHYQGQSVQITVPFESELNQLTIGTTSYTVVTEENTKYINTTVGDEFWVTHGRLTDYYYYIDWIEGVDKSNSNVSGDIQQEGFVVGELGVEFIDNQYVLTDRGNRFQGVGTSGVHTDSSR